VVDNLLEEAYKALESFCGDERWSNTWQGKVLQKLAEALDKPNPYEQ